MRKFITLISLTLLAIVIASPVGAQGPSQDGTPVEWQTKVAPKAREALDKGGETEFFVILAEQADLKDAEKFSDRKSKTAFVYQRLQETAQRTQPALVNAAKSQGAQVVSFGLVNALLVKGETRLIEVMAKRAEVSRIEANPYVKGQLGFPAAPVAQTDYSIPWHISSIKAPQVWSMGYKGAGVVVGTADTGVQWDHSALKDRYRGWNGSAASHDHNWFDAIETVKSAVPVDGNSHGTHVTGTMVGYRSDNKIGVAPDAKWIACRNMDNNGIGSVARYLTCMEFLMAPYRQGESFLTHGQPQLSADIQNNSWTCTVGEGCSAQTLATAVSNVRAAGIAFVAAAGNDGPGCSTVAEPPAIYSSAFTVGSYNWMDMLSSWSSRGPVTADGSNRVKPDIVGPGEGVTSAVPGNGFGGKSGTSMATPHIAGTIALMWSAKPSLNGQVGTTENLLKNSAIRANDPSCGPGTSYPNNMWGYGRVDAQAAVNAALSQGGSTPTATFSDVPTTHWAWSHIEAIYQAGITTGCVTTPPLAYCPDTLVSRDQMAVFLVRAKYGKTYQPPTPTGLFSDVATNHWAAPHIEKAYRDGIVTACGSSPLRFCPSSFIPRSLKAQWLLLAKYGGSYAPPTPSQQLFADVPLSHPYVAWINQLFTEGITTGCQVSNDPATRLYCPDTTIDRAQMGVFLVRTFNLPRP